MATTETARIPHDLSGRQYRLPVGRVTWRTTFRALRHRNYRLFFWGQLVSLIGTWMQQTAMSWYVYEITNSKILLGTVAAVGSAPMMIFSIWGGSLADRHPKRTILVWTQTAQMVCAFVLALGVWLHFATPFFIIVVAAINGMAMGFDMPARQAFTVEMTSREDLLNAISLNSSIVNGARVIGPSVAGLMIGAVGVAICFLFNGLSFIAVIAGLLMMRLPSFTRPTHTASAAEHAWSGIVYSIKHQRVRTILLLFLAVGVFGWSYAVLMPAFARDVLGMGANGYGALMSASGIGAFIGALIVATYGHLVTPRKCMLFAGFGMLLFFSTSNTVLQTIVPDEMRGRVMGIWSLVFGAMIPLGSLEAGSVAHWTSTPFALGFGAVICAVSGIITRIVIARRERTSAR
ncbi:MAG: MFS transporter [Verrucomicrobia bacterium]|nr:MAG: MFS transporter [Verrucomicrobiota bacterium]